MLSQHLQFILCETFCIEFKTQNARGFRDYCLQKFAGGHVAFSLFLMCKYIVTSLKLPLCFSILSFIIIN